MQSPYAESSDATLRLADEKSKKTILSASKPSCKSDFIMCASDETVTALLVVLEKMGVQPLGTIKIWSCENRKAASRNKRHHPSKWIMMSRNLRGPNSGLIMVVGTVELDPIQTDCINGF